MDKALKAFIFVNLIMSALVITFGLQTFNTRQVLKAEALELEQTAANISNSLKWGETVAWEDEGSAQPLAFSFSQPAKGEDLPFLKTELEPLGRFAATRQAQLAQRNAQLVQTRSTLKDTEVELAARTRDLESTVKKENDLNRELTKTNAELANAKANAASLQTAKSEKEQDIRGKNDNLTNLNNSLADLEIDLDAMLQERDNALADYERCKNGAAGKEQKSREARGQKGRVLAVNPDWEYVIIEKGDTEVDRDYEAFVHRGREFVGKITIRRVEDQLAIAEIMTESVAEGDQIKPGDALFF